MEFYKRATSWLEMPGYVDIASLARSVTVKDHKETVVVAFTRLEDGTFKVVYDNEKPVDEAADKLYNLLEKQEEKTADVKEESVIAARKMLNMTEANMVALTRNALKAVNATMMHVQARVRPCCASPQCRCEKAIRTMTNKDRPDYRGRKTINRYEGLRSYSPRRSRSGSPAEHWGRRRWSVRRSGSPQRSSGDRRPSSRSCSVDKSSGRAKEQDVTEVEQELVPMMVTTDAGASMAVVGRSMLLGTMKQGMSQAEIKAMQAIDMMAAKGIIEPAEQESTGGVSESGSDEAAGLQLEGDKEKPEIIIDKQSSILANFRAIWLNSMMTDRRGRVMPTVPVQEYDSLVRLWCTESGLENSEMEDMMKRVRTVASKTLKKKRQEMKARISDTQRHAEVTVVEDRDKDTIGSKEVIDRGDQDGSESDQMPDLV